jgi:hypothetical protein
MGNGDLGVAALALKGIRFNLISKKFKNQIAKKVYLKLKKFDTLDFLIANEN